MGRKAYLVNYGVLLCLAPVLLLFIAHRFYFFTIVQKIPPQEQPDWTDLGALQLHLQDWTAACLFYAFISPLLAGMLCLWICSQIYIKSLGTKANAPDITSNK